MDAETFARQLTEALDDLTDGIPIEPGDIDGLIAARVLPYADTDILTSDPGFEITATDGSRIQVTFIQSAHPRTWQ